VENPCRKNHGRQPARTSLYRESGYNANGGGLQENKSISNGKTLTGIYNPYRTAQAYRRRASASLRQKSAFLLGDRIWIITQHCALPRRPPPRTRQQRSQKQHTHTIFSRDFHVASGTSRLHRRTRDGQSQRAVANGRLPRSLERKSRPAAPFPRRSTLMLPLFCLVAHVVCHSISVCLWYGIATFVAFLPPKSGPHDHKHIQHVPPGIPAPPRHHSGTAHYTHD
jgi:hypothetical protein